ncbi:hypothetical protein HG537_0E00850 [Torulaspora globosa]|uniref:GOLD domain-containing protein n=1 Tax=Torulaspora globosa TaxID=48254 RepID=A0A7H9HWH8_9SACH|nr:hypothetical protein HG537_0E00850 [Torulaspora sp. CBS 2947]
MMFGNLWHYLVWQLVLTMITVRGLHLYLKSGETKSFYENLSKRNLLIGDIDGYVEKDGMFVDDPDLKIGISIYETFDDDHKVLNQQNSHSGDFTFTALETGEHKICIQPVYPVRNAKIRVFIELDIGSVQALDSRMKDDTRSLQSRIWQLIQRLETIRTEQKVVRQNEARFRDESEEVNSKILFWSVLQIAGLILVCYFQLRYLKNFFVKQKVV